MFSRRLAWDARPNPLSLLLERKRREGARIFDLTESNPTRAGIEYPESAILDALAQPAALRYDPAPCGLESGRQAVSQYYAARGVDIEPSRIFLTASTSEAYAYLFKLLADPGCEILIPRPSYPLFEFLARLESVVARPYPLRYDGIWHIDFESLENLITPQTKAIVVVNPNNPTGSFLKREEAKRLRSLAARDVAIISDEVFSDYGFGEDPNRVSTLAQPGGALTFCLGGLSKLVGLPQMKLAWIVAGGPHHETAMARLEWIADTYLSVATPIQVALPRILETCAGVRSQIQRRTTSNLELLRARMRAAPVSLLQIEGGWYATLQIPRTRPEEEWVVSFLENCDVLVQPGFFYDFESEAFVVLSLLTAPQIFEEGLARLRPALS
ncbi:MAG TPA: pyridoxal phosphate-dependent aminotransferase [Bryobacteraceae bacterium]